MLSQLLISSNKSSVDKYLKELCTNEKVDPIDLNVISTEENIGIQDVREIIKKIFFKPIKSSQKIVVIKKIETATTEAQNALLKILEEPPAHTGIILVADAKEQLLPTVLSRCKIINFKTIEETNVYPVEQNVKRQEKQAELKQLQGLPIAKKLKIAQDLAKNKEETLSYLKELMLLYEESMIKNHENKIITLAENILEAYGLALTTNVNLRFILEQLFLSI